MKYETIITEIINKEIVKYIFEGKGIMSSIIKSIKTIEQIKILK
jgi:hypothetical protein